MKGAMPYYVGKVALTLMMFLSMLVAIWGAHYFGSVIVQNWKMVSDVLLKLGTGFIAVYVLYLGVSTWLFIWDGLCGRWDSEWEIVEDEDED